MKLKFTREQNVCVCVALESFFQTEEGIYAQFLFHKASYNITILLQNDFLLMFWHRIAQTLGAPVGVLSSIFHLLIPKKCKLCS